MFPEVKEELKHYMYDFALRTLRDRESKVRGLLQGVWERKPFHVLFFPPEAVVVSELERSITAAMGITFYTSLAEIIARPIFGSQNIKRDHSLGPKPVDEGMVRKLDDILEDLDKALREPDLETELSEISSSLSHKTRPETVTADFYIADYHGKPLMLELKTPWPKKEDSVRSKRRMMLFRIMFAAEHGEAYVAFPYNPFGPKEKMWWAAKRIFDIHREVKLGRETWDMIGGAGTYEGLIKLVDEVGAEVRKEIKLFKF